jgi:hypothetical protein
MAAKLEVGHKFWQREAKSVCEFLERGQSWIVPSSFERSNRAERNSRFVREIGTGPVSSFSQ